MFKLKLTFPTGKTNWLRCYSQAEVAKFSAAGRQAGAQVRVLAIPVSR